MSIFDPNVPLDEAAEAAEEAYRNMTPADLAHGDQLIAMARGVEATATLPLNEWGALIAMIMVSRRQSLLTPDGEERLEEAYRHIIAQVRPTAETTFDPGSAGGGELFEDLQARLRDDLSEEQKIAAVKILAQKEIQITLPFWEWAAITAAFDELEPLMAIASPLGRMAKDVMPISAKIDERLVELSPAIVPRSVVEQLEAGGYLKEANDA